MSSSYGRFRSKVAPMQGVEFTNRVETIPAWRRPQENDENHNSALKRTHSIANPPGSPFEPKNPSSRPVFGENVHYLFNPPPPQNSWPSWSTPSKQPDVSDVDMKDVEISPLRPGPSSHEEEQNAGDGKEKEEEGSPEKRLISNAAVRRLARKRNNKGRSNRGRGGMRLDEVEDVEESEDEGYDSDGSPRRSVVQSTSNHYTLNMPGPATQKTETPYVLLGYLQFLFNLSLILVFLYLLVQFIFTVQRDVEQRISEYSMDILQEISTCAFQYKQNLCDTSPIPAMLHQCATWETCMNRDPKIVGRAKVGAEMLAEVINGFVEPISWKTLAFTLSSLAFMTVFVNALLSLYRSRHHPDRAQSSAAHHAAAMPHFPPIAPGQYPATPYAYLAHPGQGGKWFPPGGEVETESLPRQRRRLENGDAAAVKES
ncbi:hypothetical protein SCHPADRAFT_923200 [Schizopora paradoxa]|uniref:Brl1/Brr6 domain-containing protein n=1 Tax=Schizopora paradoxa TaxID=27342 RepID=A0A0H2R3F6_9AGAM|nr:hypothetical protein SCHPADRAFT_923200 [Schizopora paradoxa]